VTCIIAIKCIDGVVLAGDRKVLRGSECSLEKKLRELFPDFIIGESGLSGAMDKFIHETESYLNSGEASKKDYWSFILKLEDIADSLYKRYSPRFGENEYAFDVLFGCKPVQNQTQIFHMYCNGFAQEVKTFDIIGHGQDHVLPFIKAMHSDKSTMKDMAKVAAFSLKLVDEANIDVTVGGEPQIFLMPNNNNAHELSKTEVDQLLNNISPSILLSSILKILY
jgi:20S proteasome alpha/beta subunit